MVTIEAPFHPCPGIPLKYKAVPQVFNPYSGFVSGAVGGGSSYSGRSRDMNYTVGGGENYGGVSYS